MTENMNENNLPATMEEGLTDGMIAISPEMLGELITDLMRPLILSIGKVLENNTAALEQIAASQSIQNDRMEALERQIRLQTPVTSKQVSYLNDAIRARARELLNEENVRDGKAIVKLGNAIRKAVLARYGISVLREVPKHEYGVALSQIGMWDDALIVWDVAKEAKDRAEASMVDAEPATGVDGSTQDAGQPD